MKTLKPKSRFYTTASHALSRGMPIEELYNMAKEYNGVTDEDVENLLKNKQLGKQVSTAIMASREQKEIIYNRFDEEFLKKHPELVLFRRGENSVFFEYKNGVYKELTDQDMYDEVDSLMCELQLFDYRTSSRKVTDTIKRISSLLSRTKDKFFTDMFVYKQKWKLNLKNGLLDIDTLTLQPHTPKYFSTVQVPHEFDLEATCPIFDEFIKTVSNNDSSTAQMIQEMFGYCLTDGNPKHKVFYLYGDTARNGKSTTAKIICGLIGWGNVSTLSLAQISGDNSSVLTSLIGKQINFSDEISSKYINSSRLTALSAEAMVEINPKFKSAFLQKISAKFLITCNDLPAFNDYQGMKHRMIAIPFSYQIPQAERIERYEEVLLEKEGAGILNWALKGMEILNKNKEFTFNEESLKDMHDNNMGSNPVYSFLEWYSTDEEKVSVDDLYGSYSSKEGTGTGYRLFCHDKGLNPLNFFNFSKEVKRYANETKKIEAFRDSHKRGYQGFNKNNDDFK